MKEGLPGGTLSLSSRSEHEEARSHVARWIGSESTSARRLPARRARRIGRGDRCAAGRRRLARPGAAARGAARASGDRVDERARFVHDTLEEVGWEVLVA